MDDKRICKVNSCIWTDNDATLIGQVPDVNLFALCMYSVIAVYMMRLMPYF